MSPVALNLIVGLLSNVVPFEKNRVEIMGSFALHVWQLNQKMKVKWGPNDVDIYVRASSLYRFVEEVDVIVKKIREFVVDTDYKVDDETKVNFNPRVKNIRIAEYIHGCTANNMKISFIYVPERMSFNTVCDSFDITCCRFRMLVYKDCEYSVWPQSFQIQELTQGNRAVAYHGGSEIVKLSTRQNNVYESRWWKYRNRGFKMVTMPVRPETTEFTSLMECYHNGNARHSQPSTNWFVILFVSRLKGLVNRARQTVIDSYAPGGVRQKRARAHYESVINGDEIDISKYKLYEKCKKRKVENEVENKKKQKQIKH